MKILETEWWTMAVPPEWWAESEEESILVGDRDGVGCIEVSTLCKEQGEFDRAIVEQIVHEESDADLEWRTASPGDFSGWQSNWLEDGTAVRQWYVAAGAILLYITYSCEEENAGMDDAAVDEILDTLLLSGG